MDKQIKARDTIIRRALNALADGKLTPDEYFNQVQAAWAKHWGPRPKIKRRK